MPFIRLIIKNQDIAEMVMEGQEKRIIVYDLCSPSNPCQWADISSKTIFNPEFPNSESFYCKFAPYNKSTS